MFIVTKQINSNNISKLCRTCLREDEEKMLCLFVGPAGSSLAAKLRSLSCLEVWQGDGLPEKLCERCVTRAESALLFREQCRAADKALRQAASKVSGFTTYTTVSGCQLYQQTRAFAPKQTPMKSLKCGECDVLFMNYQDLCAHSRFHDPFDHDTSPPHMHTVESQNTSFNAEMPSNESVIYNNGSSSISHSRRIDSISQYPNRNDRAACALKCSLCNHTFPNRSQLINHNFSHGTDIVVVIPFDDDSIEFNSHFYEILGNSSYSCAIDPGHLGENASCSMTISRITVQENSSLNTVLSLETNSCTRRDSVSHSEMSSSIVNDLNYELSSPSEKLKKNTISNGIVISDSNNRNFNNVQSEKANNMACLYVRKKYECRECKKVFTQRSKLITHELFHTGEKPFKCGDCHKAYASRSKLNAHTKLHSKTDVYRCDICEKTFSYPSYLLEHSKVHETKSNGDVVINIPVKAKFECSACSKKFRFKKNLKSHIRFHIGTGLFNCEICDKSFSEKYNLKVHLRSHESRKSHKCEYCEKAFNEKGNYKEHLRIHTKVKPFVCNLCGKAFTQSSHLKSHEVSHNSIRPHQCRVCGKRFKLVSHLKRHTNSHTAVKTFECMECNQMFARAFSLKRHLKRHNNSIVHR